MQRHASYDVHVNLNVGRSRALYVCAEKQKYRHYVFENTSYFWSEQYFAQNLFENEI